MERETRRKKRLIHSRMNERTGERMNQNGEGNEWRKRMNGETNEGMKKTKERKGESTHAHSKRRPR